MAFPNELEIIIEKTLDDLAEILERRANEGPFYSIRSIGSG